MIIRDKRHRATHMIRNYQTVRYIEKHCLLSFVFFITLHMSLFLSSVVDFVCKSEVVYFKFVQAVSEEDLNMILMIQF